MGHGKHREYQIQRSSNLPDMFWMILVCSCSTLYEPPRGETPNPRPAELRVRRN